MNSSRLSSTEFCGHRSDEATFDPDGGIKRLELEENSALIQPVAHAPHDEDLGGGLGNRGQFSNEVVMKGKHTDSAIQPLKKNLAYEVDEN